MKPAPTPVKMPPAQTKPAKPNPVTPAVGSRVNIAISEDGIQTVAAPKVKPATGNAKINAKINTKINTSHTPSSSTPSSSNQSAPQEAIDDVTRMIREKLKTLRSI